MYLCFSYSIKTSRLFLSLLNLLFFVAILRSAFPFQFKTNVWCESISTCIFIFQYGFFSHITPIISNNFTIGNNMLLLSTCTSFVADYFLPICHITSSFIAFFQTICICLTSIYLVLPLCCAITTFFSTNNIFIALSVAVSNARNS